MTYPQKNKSIAIFSLTGIAVFGLQIVLGRYLSGLCLTDPVPSYMPIAAGLSGSLHWIILGVLVVLDLRKADFKRSVPYFATVLLCYVIYSSITELNSKTYKFAHTRSFSEVDWNNAKNDISVRLNEVDSLLQSKRLIGLSQPEVQDLLGSPDYVQNGNYFYRLGPEYGHINVDEKWLVLRFKSAVVISAVCEVH